MFDNTKPFPEPFALNDKKYNCEKGVEVVPFSPLRRIRRIC